jgi:hypothetical protein
MMFRDMVRDVCGACCAAAVIAVAYMPVACMNTSDQNSFEAESLGIEVQRDYLRLCDFSVEISLEKIEEAKSDYLKEDFSEFSDKWKSMLHYFESEELLSIIRHNTQTQLNETCKNVKLWIEITKRACYKSSWGLFSESKRLELSENLMRIGMRMRGDQNAILDDIASAMVTFAVFFNEQLHQPIDRVFTWRIPLVESHAPAGIRKLAVPVV